MLALVSSFHALRSYTAPIPGTGEIREWSATGFAQWFKECGNVGSNASIQAAAFILSVWSGGQGCALDLLGHEFSVVYALGLWDHKHRDAFIEWASDPWWP